MALALPLDMDLRKEKTNLVDALRAIRREVRWKPGKDIVHLEKRQDMRHLAIPVSLAGYQELIHDIVKNGNNIVYLYDFKGTHFYAVRGFYGDNEWLIIFGRGGVMETPFPPDDMDNYLSSRGFVLLGPVEEVLKWTREAHN